MRKIVLPLLCVLGSLPALAQWQPVSPPTGMNSQLFYCQLDAIDGQTAWVLNNSLPPYDIRIWRTSNGGQSWQSMGPAAPANGPFTFGVIEALDTQRVWLLLQPTNSQEMELYYTADGGQTWTLRSQLNVATGPGQMRFFSATEGLLFVGQAGRTLRTTDGGQTWQPLTRTPPLTPNQHLGELGQAPGLLWSNILNQSGQPVGFCVSTDQGLTWRSQTMPVGASGGVVFRDALHGLLPTFAGGMVATADGGQTWTPATRPPIQFGLLPALTAVPGSRAYVAGAYAVNGIASAKGSAVSTDDGQTWTTLETTNSYVAMQFSAPDAGWCIQAERFRTNPNYIYQGIGRYTGPALVTASQSVRATVPAEAYPNPSPDGLFTLRLPTAAGVRAVRVLDGLGRLVYQAPALPADQRLDLSRLPKGLYSLEVQTTAGLVRRQLLTR